MTSNIISIVLITSPCHPWFIGNHPYTLQPDLIKLMSYPCSNYAICLAYQGFRMRSWLKPKIYVCPGIEFCLEFLPNCLCSHILSQWSLCPPVYLQPITHVPPFLTASCFPYQDQSLLSFNLNVIQP